MKNRKNENIKSLQRPKDMVNLPGNHGHSIPSLSPLSNFDRIKNMSSGFNQANLLPSQLNASPSIAHTLREDPSYYKTPDYSKLNLQNPSLNNLNNNLSLTGLLRHPEHDLNRKVNNSVLSYEQNDSILKKSVYPFCPCTEINVHALCFILYLTLWT